MCKSNGGRCFSSAIVVFLAHCAYSNIEVIFIVCWFYNALALPAWRTRQSRVYFCFLCLIPIHTDTGSYVHVYTDVSQYGLLVFCLLYVRSTRKRSLRNVHVSCVVNSKTKTKILYFKACYMHAKRACALPCLLLTFIRANGAYASYRAISIKSSSISRSFFSISM